MSFKLGAPGIINSLRAAVAGAMQWEEACLSTVLVDFEELSCRG